MLKFQAVQDYYRHLMVRTTVGCVPSANLLVKACEVAAASRDQVTFDDTSVVVVTEQDLEGYEPSCQSESMTSEIWADLSVVYRVRVAGQAALARLSCIWLRYGTDQKISAEKMGRESSCSIRSNHLGGISVDIHVY